MNKGMVFKMDNITLGEPQTLTDLERNNRIIEKLAKQDARRDNIIIALVILGYLFLIFMLYLFYYVIFNNVINNIVARCL